jgi:hypothetical protein
MNTVTPFLVQISVTLVACLLLAAYIRAALRRVLVDLCGTEQRAEFWTSFSSLLLVLMPIVFGLGFAPEATALDAAILEAAGQLRWNLFGFVLALLMIGGAVAFFALVAPRPQVKS